MAEGLFDDDPALATPRLHRTARLCQLLDHGFKEHRGDGQVVCRSLRRAELFADRLEGRGVLVVAIDIAQQAAQLVEGRTIDSAVLLEAVVRPRSKLLEIPTCFG